MRTSGARGIFWALFTMLPVGPAATQTLHRGDELNARTASGAISTTHPLARADARSRTRLRGTVRGGGSRVDLSTASGSIRVD